jgi:hypothetical protein
MAFEYRLASVSPVEKFVYLTNAVENETFVVLQCENALNPTIKVKMAAQSDSSSVEYRNMHWNGKDLLFDPITLSEIKPNLEGKYTVYLSGKKIKAKQLSKEKLLGLDGMLKFASKENVTYYEDQEK